MKFGKSKPFIHKNSLDLQMHELRIEFERIMLLKDVVDSYRTKNIIEIHLYPKGNTHNS